jgi:hypothetical protein
MSRVESIKSNRKTKAGMSRISMVPKSGKSLMNASVVSEEEEYNHLEDLMGSLYFSATDHVDITVVKV